MFYVLSNQIDFIMYSNLSESSKSSNRPCIHRISHIFKISGIKATTGHKWLMKII